MDQQERIARARAALASAELRTGARSLGPASGHPEPSRPAPGRPELSRPASAGAASDRAPAVSVAPRSDAPVDGTAALAVVPGERPVAPSPVVPSPAGPVAVPDLPDRRPARSTAARGPLLLTDRPPLPVPPALTPLLPDGLRRGSTTAVLGSTSLVLAMIAAACTAREAWAAVVGQPSLGLLAAAQTGVALERLAVVPEPGVDAPTVVAALLDGIDVVVVGPGTHLADADRRRLMARARDRGSVLLPTAPWPGASTVLTVEGGRWTGVGEGDGRLRAHELQITRTGRGSAGQAQDLRVVLPLEVGADPYGLPVRATGRPAAPAVTEAPEGDGALLAPDLRLVG